MLFLNDKRFTLAVGLVVFAAVLRLVPHPYNFSLIGALALFSGSAFGSRRWVSISLPLAALFLGDLVLGFHPTLLYVYASVILITRIGHKLDVNAVGTSRLGLASLSGSTLFFFITNFGVWMSAGLYTPDFKGLVSCFIAGLPFFHWTAIGDLFFSFGLFTLFRQSVRWARNP